MYTKRTASDYRKMIQVENNFNVDSVIVWGSGNRGKQLSVLEKLFNEFNITEVSEVNHPFFQSIVQFKFNNKIIWFDNVYGGAYLSEMLHVASILGSQSNIFLGSCGALKEDMKSGDLVLPTWTFAEESSAKIYDKSNKHEPSEELRQLIKSKIDSSYKIHEGPLVTCQGMLGETYEDVIKWQKEGYIGIEMETATVFAVSSYFRTNSAALLFVSDNLVTEELMGSESHTNSKEKREKARYDNFKLALEIVSS